MAGKGTENILSNTSAVMFQGVTASAKRVTLPSETCASRNGVVGSL